MTTPTGSAAPPPVPFGTEEAPRVAVRGEARLEFEPEVARIGVTVTARDPGREAALERLTARNAQVVALVKGYGEAVAELSTGAFSVSPEPAEKGRKERARAYRGRVHVTAAVRDFTVLGELVARLAEVESARVDGPRWALRPDSPAYREARQQAVREAVRRAREYAGALGAELVALLELADPGAEDAAAPAPRGAARAAFAGDAEVLDLEPQRQTVQAQVNARFVMSRPVL